jgi:hypothetical protein
MAKSVRSSPKKKKTITEDTQILEITPEVVTKRGIRTFLNVEEMGSNLVEVKNSLQNLIFKRNEELEKEIRIKRVYLSVAALVLLIVLGVVVSKKSQAEVAMFYPSSCLGGWTNLTKATGKPDVENESGFSNLNAAILPENTQTDLFCGGFTGDIPPNKDPKLLILRIAWSLTGSTSTPEGPSSIEGVPFASSTGVILDAPASSSPSFTSPAEGVSTSTDQQATTTETPALAPAQETTQEVVPVSAEPTQPAPESVSVPVQEVVPAPAPTPEPAQPAPAPVSVPAQVEEKTPQSSRWLPNLISFLKVYTSYAYAEDVVPQDTPVVNPVPETTPINTPTETPAVAPVEPSPLVAPVDTPTSGETSQGTQVTASDAVATTTQADVPLDTPAETPKTETVKVEDPLVSPVDTPVTTPIDTSSATSTTSGSSTDVIATSTEEVATSTEATSTSKYPPFFEVEYTLDGATWTTLGGVALEELQSTQFEIPIPENASWDDLSKLQIHVKRVSNVDKAPTVFLDGMTLEVETQDFQGKRRMQRINDIVVDGEGLFANQSVQEEVVNLFVRSSSTHGIAMYDASGTLMYTTQLKDSDNYFPVNELEYGTYNYIITDDLDWCAHKTFDECTATSTEGYKGYIKFTIARPLY